MNRTLFLPLNLDRPLLVGLFVLCFGSLLIGCATPPQPAESGTPGDSARRSPSWDETPTPRPLPPCERERYTSEQGRPIPRWVYGQGEETVLVLGALRGDEMAGHKLARSLGEHLEANPDILRNRRVVILPAVNPDGLNRNRPANANGVDLNRDFDEQSQQETQALLRVIDCFQPERIIALRDFEKIDFDPSPEADHPASRSAGIMARAIARTMGKYAPDLPVGRLGSRPGSLGHFTGNRLHIPMVSLGLHRNANRLSSEALWTRYKEALIPAVTVQVSLSAIGKAKSLFWQGRYGDALGAFQQIENCRSCAGWIRKTQAIIQARDRAIAARDAGQWDDLLAAATEVRNLNDQDRDAPEWIAVAQNRIPSRPAPEPSRTASRPEPQPARPPQPSPEPQPARPPQPSPEPQPARPPQPSPEPQPARRPQPSPEPQPARPPQPSPEPAPVRRTDAPAEVDMGPAIAAFQAGRFAEARRMFEALSDCPECPEWIEKTRMAETTAERAAAALANGQWEELLTAAGRLESLDIRDPRISDWHKAAANGLLARARAHFTAGRYEAVPDVLAPIDEMAVSCPDCDGLREEAANAANLLREADLALAEDRVTEAEVLFQTVLSVNPEDETAAQGIAEIQRETENLPASRAALGRGRGLCEEGNWDEGIEALEEAISLNPECGECRDELEACRTVRNDHYYRDGLEKFQAEQTYEAVSAWVRVRPGYKSVDELLAGACQVLRRKGEDHPGCAP